MHNEGIDTIRFNVTLGNAEAEVPARWRKDFGGPDPNDADFERAARSLDKVLAFAVEHGVKAFHCLTA